MPSISKARAHRNLTIDTRYVISLDQVQQETCQDIWDDESKSGYNRLATSLIRLIKFAAEHVFGSARLLSSGSGKMKLGPFFSIAVACFRQHQRVL